MRGKVENLGGPRSAWEPEEFIHDFPAKLPFFVAHREEIRLRQTGVLA